MLGLVAALRFLRLGCVAPNRRQQTIDGGSADGEDALANLGVEVEVTVPLQSCDQARQDRLEAFATDAVGGFPEDDQRLPHRLIVGAPRHDRGSRQRADRWR